MPVPPAVRPSTRLTKGAVWFVLGVASLFALVRTLAALVQFGVDRGARPNLAAGLAWALVGIAVAAVWFLATATRRRRCARGADEAAGPLACEAGPSTTMTGRPIPQDGDDQPRWRSRLPDPAALICAPLAALLVTWPGVAHLSTRFIGATDAKYNAWLGWRMAQAWRAGSWFPTRFGDALYPIGVSLWLIDGLLPTWVTGGWNLVTGNPLLAYNLAILTGVVANFLAAHHLAGALTSRRTVRLVGAAAFATAPALTGAIDAHITFVYAFTLPLILREAIVAARGDRPLRPARLAVLLVLAFLCSAYHLIFGGLLFVLVTLAWPNSAVRARRELLRAGVAIVAAAVVLSPFIVHRLDFAARERAAGAPDTVKVTDAVTYSNDALGTLSRPADATVRLPLPRVRAEPVFAPLRPAFAGLLLLAGVALACGFSHPARRPLLVAAGVSWLLGLGPTLLWGGRAVVHTVHGKSVMWLPYRLLLEVPGLSVLRAPYRANFAFAAAACALLVVGLEGLAARLRRPARYGAVAGLVVLLVLSLSVPIQHSDFDLSTPLRRSFERIARSHRPAGAVIVVPFECGDDNRLTLWQTIHHQPSLGCSTGTAAIPWWSGMQAWVDSPELAALRCDPSRLSVRRTRFGRHVALGPDGRQRLQRSLGVEYVLFDKLAALGPDCGPLRDRVAALTRRAEVLAEDQQFKLFDLGSPRPG